MKIFQVIIITLKLASAKPSIPIFKENMITSEPWLQYSRSSLMQNYLPRLDNDYAKRLALVQWLKNRKTKQLRQSLDRVLKQTGTRKVSKSKGNFKNGRLSRFKNYHH